LDFLEDGLTGIEFAENTGAVETVGGGQSGGQNGETDEGGEKLLHVVKGTAA
jgi:hypothetical protein